MIPIGDAPNLRGHVPYVNYLLIAANVAVFFGITMPLVAARPENGPQLAEYIRVAGQGLTTPQQLRDLVSHLTAYDFFLLEHAFRPGAPSLTGLFWSMFLHGGLLSLAGNMLVLWVFGDNVERRLGSLGYLLAYVGTGAAALSLHALFALGSQLPLIGAAGAISGILGFYLVFFPRNQIRLLWLLPPFVMQVFEVPARIVLAIYLVLETLLPYLLTGSDVGVAHAAHIGGFVAGVAVAWILQRRLVSARPRELAATSDEPAVGEGIAEAIVAGRMAAAARGYLVLSPRAARRLLTPEQGRALAGWLHDDGHDEAALVVLRRVLRDFPRAPATAPAHLLAAQILLEEGQGATASPHFLQALDLAAGSSEMVAAAGAGLESLEARQKRRIGKLHGR